MLLCFGRNNALRNTGEYSNVRATTCIRTTCHLPLGTIFRSVDVLPIFLARTVLAKSAAIAALGQCGKRTRACGHLHHACADALSTRYRTFLARNSRHNLAIHMYPEYVLAHNAHAHAGASAHAHAWNDSFAVSSPNPHPRCRHPRIPRLRGDFISSVSVLPHIVYSLSRVHSILLACGSMACQCSMRATGPEHRQLHVQGLTPRD
jgi:hypothetical protein